MERSSERSALAKRLRAAADISESYASLLAGGDRTPSDKLAIRIWRETGIKLGRIKDAADSDIEALARLRGVQ